MPHVKRRPPPTPGSMTAALDSFRAEVRFYREIAPALTVRVPYCYEAADGPDGTRLVLEDLSDWKEGGEPAAIARERRQLHDAGCEQAAVRWPWLRPVGAAAELVERLYEEIWPRLAEECKMPGTVRAFGAALLGQVTVTSDRVAGIPGRTLAHGDASGRNVRTSPDGVVAFLDWEDVSCLPGVSDLAWFLVSTVNPEDWALTREAYGPGPYLEAALPAALVQGYLSLADTVDDEEASEGWVRRLEMGVRWTRAVD